MESQRLARIATVSSESQPDVAPVVFMFDGTRLYVSGLAIQRTMKYKNVGVNPKVALVVDDLETIDPWRPRGIKIHGRARIVSGGQAGAASHIEITPRVHWSWGIEAPAVDDGKALFKKTSWEVAGSADAR